MLRILISEPYSNYNKPMRTYLDCIPCFLKQTLNTGRIATPDEAKIRKMLDVIGDQIKSFPTSATPPEMGQIIYKTIRDISGVDDPYKAQKAVHIQQSLAIFPSLQDIMTHADDKLLTAIRIAIAGNIIDLGMEKSFDLKNDLDKILHQKMAICDIQNFKSQLIKANVILYLGDNSGESVFDRILIEAMNKPVTYVVRDKPVINDVTYADAIASGIDSIADIITSGSDAPGTFVDRCSPELQQLIKKADLIISKGQGNFESLSETILPVFFLLKAKCPVIANHLGVLEDDIVLKQSNFFA